MSRSNPNDGGTPNPSQRWFEWNGETGTVRYYDKELKQNIDVGANFTFIVLDELGSVKGWNEASKSGIYSNEVRDTRQDVLIVKAFKGGTLAEGLYRDIKEHVTSKSVGGQFVANCYVAVKVDKALVIGSMQFKGAALGSWMEFRKAHRAELLTKAVRITGSTEGKKGRIVFKMPTFAIAELSPESNAAAVALDVTLQEYLKGYLSRTKRDQVDAPPAHHVRDEDIGAGDDPPDYTDADVPPPDEFDASDIPFAWLLPLVLPILGSMALIG